MIDEFNKKLLEKGTTVGVLPSELPPMSKYLAKRERPQTAVPRPQGMISHTSKVKLGRGDINDAL